MRRTEARQAMLKFMDVFGRWEASELSQLEPAELLAWESGHSVAGVAVARKRAKQDCWTVGSARRQASEFRLMAVMRWRRCIGPTIKGSRCGISTSISSPGSEPWRSRTPG